MSHVLVSSGLRTLPGWTPRVRHRLGAHARRSQQSAPVRDAEHHGERLAFVDECFERFGSDEAHPVFALVGLVSERIREYESRVHPWPETSTPASLLAFLMEQHGLRQSDLPEIGAQSAVSNVLAGKRALNLRQTKALARRFSVPMELLAG